MEKKRMEDREDGWRGWTGVPIRHEGVGGIMVGAHRHATEGGKDGAERARL